MKNFSIKLINIYIKKIFILWFIKIKNKYYYLINLKHELLHSFFSKLLFLNYIILKLFIFKSKKNFSVLIFKKYIYIKFIKIYINIKNILEINKNKFYLNLNNEIYKNDIKKSKKIYKKIFKIKKNNFFYFYKIIRYFINFYKINYNNINYIYKFKWLQFLKKNWGKSGLH